MLLLTTWTLDVDFNSRKYSGGRLFIDWGARCGFVQIQLSWWSSLYRLGRWMWILTAFLRQKIYNYASIYPLIIHLPPPPSFVAEVEGGF
jgi:hypothetical protein